MPERDYLWLNLRDLPYFRAMLRAVEASFYQQLELPRPILDVGCGDGHFATVAFEAALDVGIDPCVRPLRQAVRLGGYRMLVQADGGRLPFPDGLFGSAISNSVLEHIPHIEQVLRETGRVLKLGAPFAFCVPNPGYLAELSLPAWLRRLGFTKAGEVYRRWFRRMSRVFHAEPPETWQRWLEAAGFRLEHWWHYFSPEAMRMLEWGHFFGVPTLLPHALSGRWILVPRRWNLALTERLVRPYVRFHSHPQGTFTFFLARKATE